jgi:hypothetical protein
MLVVKRETVVSPATNGRTQDLVAAGTGVDG